MDFKICQSYWLRCQQTLFLYECADRATCDSYNFYKCVWSRIKLYQYRKVETSNFEMRCILWMKCVKIFFNLGFGKKWSIVKYICGTNRYSSAYSISAPRELKNRYTLWKNNIFLLGELRPPDPPFLGARSERKGASALRQKNTLHIRLLSLQFLDL